MNIIEPQIIVESPLNGTEILKLIEKAGRTAYKSEDKITQESAEKFIAMLISRGHFSVIEHYSVSVRVICDRGVTHEIVRHRLASYTQESTRYCNYTKGQFGNELTVIKPIFWDLNKPSDVKKYNIWRETLLKIEDAYNRLISLGSTPQEARSILPNSLKTEIVMTMNLREWRHFLELRTTKAAHPQMREIAIPILDRFKSEIPIIFDDIKPCL